MSKIKSEIWDGKTPHLYAHLKIDGNFLRIIKNDIGEIKCLSSIDTDLTLQITNCKPRWLINLYKNMPLNSSILGELYYYDVLNKVGMPSNYIKTGLANRENYFDENAVGIDKRSLGRKQVNNKQNQQNQHQLCFSVFAIEYGFEGITSISELEKVKFATIALGVEFAPYLDFFFVLNKRPYPTKDELLQDFLPKMVESGKCKGLAEGFMLKHSNLTGWKKVKKESTIDCFITGYVPGKGKYFGKVGSLTCCVYNREGKQIQIATAGGFNDEIRDWLTEQFEHNIQDILGQVIELQYQFVATQGRLRHPRFKNWRDDKLMKDCTTDQDEELVKHWG